MKTYFVTGGAGFIGSCLVRQLVHDREARVVNYDKLTYAGNLDSIEEVLGDPSHTFAQGDICDTAAVMELLDRHRPHCVINLAAETHVDRSIDGPGEFVKSNVVGTVSLLESVRHYWQKLPNDERSRFRFLHVSTDEVYGSLGQDGYFSETTPYAPNSPYSASKAAADHFVRAYFQTYGLPVLTTHCSNNYGPYQFPEKLIPLMILNTLQRRPLPVYGDGQNVRDWLFVDDHARALRCVLNSGTPGQVYDIGGRSERTNLQVVRLICEIIDRLSPSADRVPSTELICFVADRPGHDRRYAIDTAKIQRELGWQATVSFERGIEATVQWYLDNPRWTQRVSSGKYRRERLGLGNGTLRMDES